MKVELKPVYAKDRKPDDEPQLYDIYVEGRWIGSRRTVEQCNQAVANHAH